MLFLAGVLFMVVGVALSIALHECGHMLPAKKFGVRVPQYMIGFGPTIWSRHGKETEYGIKGIPLGGYVRMIGMYPPKAGDPEGTVRASSTGRFTQLADEVREQSYEELRPGDENRVFYKLKTWQKVTVMFGGPFMNLVIAAVVLVVMVSGVGMPKLAGTKVTSLTTCLTKVADGAECPAGQEAPAASSGIKLGDEIVSVAGQKVSSNRDATRVIRENGDKPIPFVVERDGKNVTLTVTPKTTKVVKLDGKGDPVTDATGKDVMVDAGFVGLSIGQVTLQRDNPAAAVPMLGESLKQTAGVVLNIPSKMQGVAKAAFGDEARDPNGPISVVGVTRIAGDVAESKQVELGQKVLLLLNLLASLNLALFVFNLIPLMPLDGGHIAGALWEAIKRPIARARGITGPVYADVTKALPIAYAVSILLIGMSVLLIYADVVKPITFN
ncbi:site-2 protease family protein [Dermacoccus abyssi]|uniref:M50 family metallopeptidase n=1 Tax=Dermacoccus abyssi TaxID=322596 RepID=UPI0021A30C4A|nr:site-2 protease family protein [Dermacoccus abyssi]MCT1988051.1 site-2 protease family protein [Dermacoccus abyssi]